MLRINGRAYPPGLAGELGGGCFNGGGWELLGCKEHILNFTSPKRSLEAMSTESTGRFQSKSCLFARLLCSTMFDIHLLAGSDHFLRCCRRLLAYYCLILFGVLFR